MDMFTKMGAHKWTFLTITLSTLFYTLTNSSSVQLEQHNIDNILRSNEIVFVNFYADWCRFSQMLGPVFDDAAKKIKEEFPEEGKVAFGKVDCDKETGIAAQYHVSKYPTLKLFRHGTLVKREYRGQRSQDALASFVRDQLKDSITKVNSIDDLDNLDRKKRHLIGYFDTEQSPDYASFQKLSSQLKDDCTFHAAIGEISAKDRFAGNKIVFRPPNPDDEDIPFSGRIMDGDFLLAWATDKCVPVVREITFENAEELTEEGLPFLILFHSPEDTETPEKYRKLVSTELLSERNSINCLTADGLKFSHPLYHLGKQTSDLPILAIDSFRHMYLWPHDPRENLDNADKLKQFIADLHSGKLHREFHHGPDPASQTPAPPGSEGGTGSNGEIATVAPDGSNGQPHMHIQQQIMLTNQGISVQIVRVMHYGPDSPESASDHLLQINPLDAAQNQGDNKKDGENLQDGDDKVVDGSPPGDNELPDIQEDIKLLQEQEQRIIKDKITDLPKPTGLPPQQRLRTKQPPTSMFKHLFPSRTRYTILKDEL